MTAEAFDEEGFFRSGDAARFLDDAHPEIGLRFDGRLAEDFKLMSGTWVNVGNLRTKLIAEGAPYVWTWWSRAMTGTRSACWSCCIRRRSRALCETLWGNSSLADIACNEKVRLHFQKLLDKWALESTGSSNHVAAAIVLAEPPSFDVGEVTDKGSINQRTVLKTRNDLVLAMYGDALDTRVLRATRPGR